MPITLVSPKLTNEEDETILQPLRDLISLADAAYKNNPRHSIYKAIEQLWVAVAELESLT